MRTPLDTKTPKKWLRDVGLTPFKIMEVWKSFDPKTRPTLNVYRAPHTFLRFHGRSSSSPVFAPNYWADGTAMGYAFGHASQFNGFLTSEEISRIAKNYFRELAAICHNWNDLDGNTMWMITLRGSETLEGLEGPAAPQPTFAKDPRTGAPPTASVLPGGGIQVYLNPGTPFICTPVNW